MVYIAGMRAYFGSDDSPLNGQASSTRELPVKSFYLDETEVTNEKFYDFVQLTGLPGPWDGGKFVRGAELHPVSGVSWGMANAFCEAVGKRLPTEAEWEFVARGIDNRTYSFGETVPPEFMSSAVGDVKSFPGNVVGGVFDLSGSVPEWVDAPYDTVLVDDPDSRVVRGGGNGFVRRNAERDIAINEFDGASFVGFRCAANVGKPPHPDGQLGAYTQPAPEPPRVKPAVEEGQRIIISDDFTSNLYSWIPVEELYLPDEDVPDKLTGRRSGLHPLHAFHLEINRDDQHMQHIYSRAFPETDNYTIHAVVEVVHTPVDLPFGFGIAFGFNESHEDGFVLVVRPNENTIDLATRSHKFSEGGPSDKLYQSFRRWDNVFDNRPVDIVIRRAAGGTYSFEVNGQPLAPMTGDEKKYMDMFSPETGAYAGMFLITYTGSGSADDKVAHVHFSKFEIIET